MSKSQMVIATKYILEVPVAGGNGAYKKDGQKKEIHTKVLPRAYVENRNLDVNNELYIIDEDATEQMVLQRDKNIIENAAKSKRESLTMADLIDKVAVKEVKKEPKKKDVIKEVEVSENDFDETTPIEDLKAFCDDNNIKYHHKAGVSKLLELINE